MILKNQKVILVHNKNNNKMKKGFCVLDDNEKSIKYLIPEGAGLGYALINVEENSLELWEQGKHVEFQIQNDQAVIVPSLQDKVEKFFSKFNPFDSPHAGLSKKGTGPGATKIKEDIISPQTIPQPRENFGTLLHTEQNGWIVRYVIQEYKFQGSITKTVSIPVLPVQAKNLSPEKDNGKKVLFIIEEHYIAPSEDINNAKGEFVKAATLISDVKDFNKEISLFHPETSSHEVFAIKNNIAFIGYKLPNGDFHFECIPYTENTLENIQDYVEEQIKLHNIEEHQTTWMESICQYWYNKGKLNKGKLNNENKS